MSLRLLAVAALASTPAAAWADDDPCAGVDCGGAGTCFAERGAAMCLCDEGLVAEDGACVPAEAPAPRDTVSAAAGRRVVEAAVDQLGRGPLHVGRDVDDPMHVHMRPGDWWCSELVSWAYRAGGAPLSGGGSGGFMIGNNLAMRRWFEQRGLWIARGSAAWETFEPRPGDFFRLDTARGGHSGIVRGVDGADLLTIEGNVDDRVRLGRYPDFRSDPRIDGFGLRVADHDAPLVDAGLDARARLPDAIFLAGVVTDDDPSERVAVRWELLDGPADVAIEDATAPGTWLRVDSPGRYVLRLSADDGEHVAADRVEVTVTRNQAPRVTATHDPQGDPEAARLVGAIEDDDPEAPWIGWSQVEGPGRARFEDAGALATRARFDEPGRYVLRLLADDGELEGSADVTVVVPAGHYGTCAVYAGRDRAPAGPALALLALAGLLARRRRRAAQSMSVGAGSSAG